MFSGFNQPKDISMDNHYEALCGVTQVELEHYLQNLLQIWLKVQLYSGGNERRTQMQYDGYHFGSGLLGVYNPFSLLNALI